MKKLVLASFLCLAISFFIASPAMADNVTVQYTGVYGTTVSIGEHGTLGLS